jgi:hypothetical protein
VPKAWRQLNPPNTPPPPRKARAARAPKPRKPPPEPHWHSFHSKIAGVTHHNDDGSERQEIIPRCRIDDILRLVREPANPVDPNAIKVFRLNGEQLGYLTAFCVSNGLAADMDRGVAVQCSISAVTGGEDGRPLGINLKLTYWTGPVAPPALITPSIAPERTHLGPILVALLVITAVVVCVCFVSLLR